MRARQLIGFAKEDPVMVSAMGPPLWVALFSVVGLAAQNPHSGIGARHLAIPLGFAVAVAAVAWLASRFLSGDAHRRSLLAAGIVVVALFFGYLASPVAIGIALATGGVATWLLRTRRDLSQATRFLNVTGMILLMITGAQGLRGLGSGTRPGPGSEAGSESRSPAAPGAVQDGARPDPDIFLIVLDAYSGPRWFDEVYDVEMGAFIEELETLGFVVPRQGRANYVSTVLSVASMLDWDYLEDALLEEVADSGNPSPVYERMHWNATTRFLRERGYRFVFFRSSFPPLNGSPEADLQLPEMLAESFARIWVEATVLPLVVEATCRLLPCGPGGLGYWADGTTVHRWRFETLGDLDTSDAPTFVFSHVLLPHEPFVFDENCSAVIPFLPRFVDESNEEQVRVRYAAQVQCLNRLLADLARDLVADRDPPPIVLFQSDHGYGRFGLRLPRLAEADPVRAAERGEVFAAYHLPDGGAEVIYDSITPVNAVRGVFRHYFDLDLPPLPDRGYWSWWEDPFRPERMF